MARTINHPVLGSLEPNRFDGWGGTIDLPEFGKGVWPTTLEVNLPGDKGGPDPKGITLVLPLIEHAATLADLILDGMWNELQGNETQNGHWWARKGGLDEASEQLDEPMTERDDLLRVLTPDGLFVREDVHGDGELTAGISFACEFEQEHSLDVLTDGTRVLGTGYALDAEKYERYSAITPAERKARHDAALKRIKKAFGKKSK